MKKIQLSILTGLILMLLFASADAQGWNQNKKGIYSAGVGGVQVIAVGNFPAYVPGPGLALNFSGEYRIHRFVGLGFETGLDVLFGPYHRPYYDDRVYRRRASIGIPIVIKANVHILEAAKVSVANKLDVYAGLNFGGGPAFYTGPDSGAYGFLVAGPQVGVRYWFDQKVGVFAEFGWGATFANIGFSF